MFRNMPPSEELKHQFDHSLDNHETVYDAETIILNSRYNHMLLSGHHIKETALKIGNYLLDGLAIKGCCVNLCLPSTVLQEPEKK